MARAVTLRSGLHRTLRWMFAPIQHIAGRAKRTRRMRQPTCESRQTAALMADVRSPEQKRGPASDASPDRQESINESPERTPFRHLSSGANRDRVYSRLLPRWASMNAMLRFRDVMAATLHGDGRSSSGAEISYCVSSRLRGRSSAIPYRASLISAKRIACVVGMVPGQFSSAGAICVVWLAKI